MGPSELRVSGLLALWCVGCGFESASPKLAEESAGESVHEVPVNRGGPPPMTRAEGLAGAGGSSAPQRGVMRPPERGMPQAPVAAQIRTGADNAPTENRGQGCAGGLSHGQVETRTRFASGAVPAGETCLSEAQTRRCSNGELGSWSGAYAEPSCVVLDPTVAPAPPSAADAAWVSLCTDPDAYDGFVPRNGETCWEFRTHENPGIDDTTPLELPGGERIIELYYAVPWPAGSIATRIRTRWTSPAMYASSTFVMKKAGATPGHLDRAALGTVLGKEASLIAMAGTGSCNQVMPDNVGLWLPDDGVVMVQWHVVNDTGEVQQDRSAVEICTVPASAREHTASITLLGTEDLGGEGFQGFGPGTHVVSSTCENLSDEPITLLRLTPLMRSYGRRMESVLRGADGDPRPVLDVPYRVDRQHSYAMRPPVVLQPGDALDTICHYENSTEARIPYGESASVERCYQLALSYPAHTFKNGVLSLNGADNTCWQRRAP